jgi:hypothetical protein
VPTEPRDPDVPHEAEQRVIDRAERAMHEHMDERLKTYPLSAILAEAERQESGGEPGADDAPA